MADDDEFRPKLGRPGKERKRLPRSQLAKLAKTARWGKVITHSRPKLVWGTVRHKGRGKGAAAITRHHAHSYRRRIFMQTSIAAIGPSGTKAFASHISYIARDGTSEHDGAGRIFDRSSDNADRSAFNERARNDVRQFRWMVSPNDVGEMEDLTRFTRTLMNQVERDLRREIDWVAASHFNTVHPHIHIAIRGGEPGVDELIIARRYLSHGLRHRVEEIIGAELGLQRPFEIAHYKSRIATADRYTEIDKDIERAAVSGYVDLSRPNQSYSRSSWSTRLTRLAHLRSRGLAEHLGGSVWHLNPGWSDTLRQMGRQQETQVDLSRVLGDRLDAGNLQEFSTGLPGAFVTGRLSGVIVERAATGKHLAVLEGLDGRQWTARLSAREARALPEPGSIVTFVSAPGASRAASLEQGSTADGEALPIRFIVDAWIPIDLQIRRKAYTWLDQLDDARLMEASGFGAEVRQARLARQLWLEAEGLYPAVREDLEARELKEVAETASSRLGKRFIEIGEREIFRGVYSGYVDTAQGRFALIAGETRFTLAAWTEGQAPVPGQQAIVERSTLVLGKVLGRARTLPP